MNALSLLLAAAAPLFASEDQGKAWTLDFGADLRVRQEFMDHVPGLPGGGVLSGKEESGYKNHMRYRPRVWADFRADERFRLYLRLTDEFRWNVHPYNDVNTFPDELVIDNLFFEAKDLFDGRFDFAIGRQDLFPDGRALYGLDHVFVDGTPGDGSRTTFSDVVRFGWKFTETERLDVFMLHNGDSNPLRWGTERCSDRALTGIAAGADPEMTDWGWGGVWSGRLGAALPYQLFAMQKITESWHDKAGGKHPWTRRELFGFKLVPQLTEEWSLQAEGMAQVGRNGDGDALSGWSAYAGGNWKSARKGWRPFAKLGFHYMSGDPDAADEDGGHDAWDPMWARAVNDSEMFLYGTHYGVAWWSNMLYLKLTGGVDFSRHHSLVASTGPMFAAVKDGLGGGDGAFKGYLSQLKYSFPIWTADPGKGERFEIFCHILGELFNTGDYFASGKSGWFLRWQVEVKF